MQHNRRHNLRIERLELRYLLAAVHVIEAPSDVEFVDMGYDVDSNEVGIVGYVVDGSDKTATVFEINATEDGFDTATLADLPDATGKAKVFGISSDGSRAAGLSKSPGTTGGGEGTTWLKSFPSSPLGIGTLVGSGFGNNSLGVGAWKDGVVGNCGGGDAACVWSISSSIRPLEEHEGAIASAYDVSSNGEIVAGVSNHEGFTSSAYYWDSFGITKLQDPFNEFSIALSISPDGSVVGGWVGEFDEFDNDYINAAVWNRNTTNVTLLKYRNGDRFEGKVFDVSNLGYAVGETIDGRGFIWHPSFDEPKIFEDWLTERQADYSPKVVSRVLSSISEDRVNGKLRFTVLNQAGDAFVEVDVPEIITDNPFSISGSAADHVSEGDDWQVVLDVVPEDFSRSFFVETVDARLTVPRQVSVPAGAVQVSFSVSVVDDTALTGDSISTVSIQPIGFKSIEASVTIQDDEALAPFRNPVDQFDVNGRGDVTALDALLVINLLSRHGTSPVDLDWDGENTPENFYDVSGDGQATALDALRVINELNRRSNSQIGLSEGEGIASWHHSESSPLDEDDLHDELLTRDLLFADGGLF